MGIRKDKEHKYWIYQFQHLGKNYGARGFATRRDAEAARVLRRTEVVNLLKQTPTGITFRGVALAYLDYSERKHAKNTYQTKARVYRTFLSSQGDLNMADIQPSHIREYLTTLPTNALYNARRKDLSAVFEWGINNYRLPITNPCKQVDKMSHDYKVKAVPSEEEVLKIIMSATPGDEQDIIMCCVHLLGRIDEILKLTWQDVNLEKRAVTLWTRKRKDGALEPDDLPMNDDLHLILSKRHKARKSEKWVFYNEATESRYLHRPKMMAAICKRAGIEPIGQSKRKVESGKNKGKFKMFPLYYGFHSLRHFMASHLIDQEKTSLKSVSKLLRHKNIKTTEIYIHSIDESVRSAMTKIEGKFTPKKAKPIQIPDTEKAMGNSAVT